VKVTVDLGRLALSVGIRAVEVPDLSLSEIPAALLVTFTIFGPEPFG
jgi:hypothetical protein